jgi:Mg-chelatase subunit ChlD
MRKVISLLLVFCISLFLLAENSLDTKTVKETKTFTVSGNVQNEKGKVVRNASIALKGKKQFSARADKNGDFSMNNIPAGDYKLSVNHSEYDSYTESLSISGNESVNITLSAKTTGNLKGKVVDKEKKPVAYASIMITGTSYGSQTDSEGKYIIEDIPFGTYDVICQMMGFSTIRKENVTLKNAKHATLNFTLERSAVQLDAVSVIKEREELVSASKTSSGGKNQPERPRLKEDSDKKKEAHEEDEEIVTIDAIAAPSSPAGYAGMVGDEKYKIDKYEEGMSATSTTETPALKTPTKPIPTSSGLRAGYSDDNKQFNYYLHFLERFRKQANHIAFNVEERFIISCIDENDKSLPNAFIRVLDSDNNELDSGKTMANGEFLYFAGNDVDDFFIEATYQGSTKKMAHSLTKPRYLEIRFEQTKKQIPKKAPLDIVFIMDTTGSMGDEINRLRQTLEIITMNIESFSPNPALRLGMVLYKDKSDAYVTKVVPFTDSIEIFQNELNKIDASGGGDYPEDLQSALYDTIKKMEWNENGIRLAFIITDAPPHLDYNQEYSYFDAAREAKQRGIKLFSLGTGGLDINGEYALRQLSQYTSACYTFLTYGEKGESAGGKPGSVSHHTGENFQTDKLESIIIHFVKEELRAFNDMEIVEADDYFIAQKVDDEQPKETLENLFGQAFSQLVDFSTIKLEKDIPTSISPIVTKNAKMDASAEYFYDNMMFSLVGNNTFKATERKDLQPILEELRFQLDALSDEENAAELGKFLGAKLLITSSMYKRENEYEMILKLLNVETIEILSVTKVKIDKRLGL